MSNYLFLRNPDPEGKVMECELGEKGSTDFFDHSLEILYFWRGGVRFGSERSYVGEDFLVGEGGGLGLEYLWICS